jgi:hypothetical protein
VEQTGHLASGAVSTFRWLFLCHETDSVICFEDYYDDRRRESLFLSPYKEQKLRDVATITIVIFT